MAEPSTFLNEIVQANKRFCDRIQTENLPVKRAPGRMVITCMDNRVNLEAIGIPSFRSDGSTDSNVRVVRTIGAIAESRSLIIGVHLAGIREIAVVGHTDCGCSLAWSNSGKIANSLKERIHRKSLEILLCEIGEPLDEQLRSYLMAFSDVREAVRLEVHRIKELPFMPEDVIVHGLVYDLATAKVEVVADGAKIT